MKTNTQFLIPLTFLFAGAAQAVVAPTIKAVSVTPTTAPAGTMFKFTAELKAPLTTGNKVKIDLGKGLASMTGTKTSYSLSRAIYTTGAQTYKVGIYNAKNVLQGKVSSGNYAVSSKTIQKNNPPTLTLVSGDDSIELGKVYTLQLKATDSDNNLRSVTVDWGEGFPETQTAINDKTLTFTHTYSSYSYSEGKDFISETYTLSATAKDDGRPSFLTSTVLLKEINVTAPPAGSYSKICNSGALEGEEDCPINPILGNKATDWACTKDNKTGLIWEVKNTDGGLRDMYKRYTNYNSDYDPYKLYGAETNAHGFTLDVNTLGLCGASDWRMPTKDELLGIVKVGVSHPTNIDKAYFPNTPGDWLYWSSSPNTDFSDSAWSVAFGYPNPDYYGYARRMNYNVRLVRSDKPN